MPANRSMRAKAMSRQQPQGSKGSIGHSLFSLWRCATTALALDAILNHKLGIRRLRNDKNRVSGIIQNLLIGLFQRRCAVTRKSFSLLQFHPVIDIQSNVSGRLLP